MTTINDVRVLSQVALFARLSEEELLGLSRYALRHMFLPGQEIIREGDRDQRLFVIVRGGVDVIKGRGMRNERLFATLGPSEYFGEMAIIDDLVRSATVVAREETEVLSLDHWDLRREIERNPSIALELLTMMSQRVRVLEKIIMSSLGGLLPICLNCKNIRTESGAWVKVEDYITDHSTADFTHGICPDCLKKLYPHHFPPER